MNTFVSVKVTITGESTLVVVLESTSCAPVQHNREENAIHGNLLLGPINFQDQRHRESTTIHIPVLTRVSQREFGEGLHEQTRNVPFEHITHVWITESSIETGDHLPSLVVAALCLFGMLRNLTVVDSPFACTAMSALLGPAQTLGVTSAGSCQDSRADQRCVLYTSWRQ